MKNIYIQDFGDVGGATNSLKELVKNLKNQYNVTPIIITSDKNSVNEFADENNIENYAINHKQFIVAPSSNIIKKIIKEKFPFLLYCYNYLLNIIALKKLEKKINFNEIDFIHTNVIRSQLGFMINKKYGIKHVVHLREFSDLDYNCKPLMKNYISYINKYSTCYIAISNVIKEHWIKKGLDSRKMNVIYNGVDVVDVGPKASRNGKIKMIFCGQLCESKGQIQVIEALNKIPKNLQKIIKLDFYGTGDNKYIEYLRKKVTEYNLKSLIEFKGFDRNVRNKLYDYDVGFICSKSEAFGRVTVEYMLSKVLVVASDSGANKELIKDNMNGLLYFYGNIDDLKSKIELSIALIKENSSIVDDAYKNAKEKYTSDINSKNIFNLYNRL